MKVTAIKTILAFVIFHFSMFAIAQTADWRVEGGRAFAEKRVSIPAKSSEEIYRETNRWLVAHFENPEENLKAKIHGEYLRGVAQVPGFITSGPLRSADLQYTFTFEIVNEGVRFKITDALIVYAGGQDADVDQGAVHRAENFFVNQETRKQRQSGYDNDQIVNALNNFSESLFRSYEEMVLRQN